MMSIRRHSQTTATSSQVIPLYRSVLLSKCTSVDSSLHPCLPLLWIISDCILMMNIEDTLRQRLLPNKSFHCTEVFCCLNVPPLILLCTLVFLFYESSLIVFSWWVFRDKLRQRLLLHKSFHCTEVCCCLNVHLFILFCTLVFPYYESSLIVFSWWVSKTHPDVSLLNYKSFHCK